MKNPNFGLAPTVIGFGSNTLKERIIAIVNYKKPTALTTALSALLVVGIGSTAMFTITPKTEAVTVSDPLLAVTASEPALNNDTTENSEPVTPVNEPTSEPVLDNDSTDNDPETGEPEPIDPEAELESKYPRGEHSIPIFPEDKNGIYYSESGDVVRVPVHIGMTSLPSCIIHILDKNDSGKFFAHAVYEEERPSEYYYWIYSGDEFAVLTRNEAIWREQIALYSQMSDDGIITPDGECFHDLNSLD